MSILAMSLGFKKLNALPPGVAPISDPTLEPGLATLFASCTPSTT